MMSDIDWSKAPEGATHCLKWAGRFYKPANKGYLWNGFQWIQTVNDFEWTISREGVESRPSSPALSGEGLPPVGSRVRIIDNGTLVYGHGESGEVIAHVDGTAVVRMSYGLGCFVASCLAPEPTPEQIAAEDREKAVQEMIKAINGDERHIPICTDLYCAGYRKTGEANERI